MSQRIIPQYSIVLIERVEGWLAAVGILNAEDDIPVEKDARLVNLSYVVYFPLGRFGRARDVRSVSEMGYFMPTEQLKVVDQDQFKKYIKGCSKEVIGAMRAKFREVENYTDLATVVDERFSELGGDSNEFKHGREKRW